MTDKHDDPKDWTVEDVSPYHSSSSLADVLKDLSLRGWTIFQVLDYKDESGNRHFTVIAHD